LEILENFKNNISKDNNIKLLGHHSWIQNIPEFNESKYLRFKNNDFDYGFYIKLYKKRFHKILPTNKLEQMCMERLFGIAFQQEGYDASNSIQGEHFTTPFETLNFQKKFFKRK